MSRSAVLATAAAFFCVAFSRPVEAQRTVPRTPIVKRPAEPVKPSKDVSKPTADDAKGPMIAPGTGSIVGAALDSLHDQMLVNAGIAVVGLPGRHAVTTAGGMFRIDSIPPGKYVLALSHPVLDSLGIGVRSDTVAVAAGRLQTIELAIPSAHTVIATVCSPAKLRFGPGVILGRVVDADTDEPSTGARVSVAWTETEVSETTGIQTAPRLRTTTVAADGTYRICGVPPNFTGSLQAARGTAETAEVPIHVSAQPLSIRMLFMPPSVVAGASTTSAAAGANAASGAAGDSVPVRPRRVARAVITGKVTNAGGVPVSGARVSVQGSASSTSTGSDGKFTLTGVLPGTQSVLVRRVGYSPVELPLDVTALETNQITVRMGAYAPVLSSVDVKAKADPLKATGFERRRKMGMGKYMDYNDIKKAQPTYTSDILRRIPGLYITGSGSSTTVATTRSQGCVAFNIDGNPVASDAGQSIDEIVGAQDVVAVEFYQPVDVPMELSAGSNSGCALLMIWTKGKLAPSARR
jgi:hypothetical protein